MPSQRAEQNRTGTHQRPSHRLRKRVPNPSLPWHRAHLFMAAFLALGCPLLHVSSLDAALPLLILQHARKKISVSNNSDERNIVSDKCHKLSFYFRLAPFGQRPALFRQPLVRFVLWDRNQSV